MTDTQVFVEHIRALFLPLYIAVIPLLIKHVCLAKRKKVLDTSMNPQNLKESVDGQPVWYGIAALAIWAQSDRLVHLQFTFPVSSKFIAHQILLYVICESNWIFSTCSNLPDP